MTIPPLHLLLRTNAVYSVITGLVAVAAHDAVAEALAVPAAVVSVLGVGLICFGVAVAWFSVGSRATPRTGLVIAAADAAWVVMVLVFGVVSPPPTSGLVLALATAVPVAAFAVMQSLAAIRLVTPPMRTIEVQQSIDGTPDEIWAVMVDHDLYARLSPNLSRVGPFEPLDGASEAGRRCWDVRGRGWDETLTSWEPGRSFSVVVDTSAADYPYPLEEMRGAWSVTESGAATSLVTMRFDIRPRPGVAGRSFATALAGAGPGTMRRIIAGWESAVLARRVPARIPPAHGSARHATGTHGNARSGSSI